MSFQLYEQVRVVKLISAAEDYDGWRFNKRPPQVGDVGTFIDMLSVAGHPDRYVVESSGDDGITIWLADFSEDELEPATNE